VRGDIADVGLAGHEPVRDGPVGEGGDQGLALRRPGGDGGALDAEEAALEVDVVQLVPVDEAAGRRVPDLGVVLPAVPEPAYDFHVVGGLVEQLGEQFPRAGAVEGVDRGGVVRRPKCAASSARAVTRTRTPARPVLT
jgi:hypothetical protein